MKRAQRNRLRLLLAWPLVASAISALLSLNFTASIAVFFAVPAVALSRWYPRHALKAFVFCVISTPLALVIDYVARINDAWTVATSSAPILRGTIAAEHGLWFFVLMYLVIMFYEGFLEHNHRHAWSRRFPAWAAIGGLVFGALLLIGLVAPSLLRMPFSYLVIVLAIAVAPIGFELVRFPTLIPKFALAGVYFFYFFLVYEITALARDWWTFPSTQFAGWIELFSYRFPLEELVGFVMLASVSILSFYEYFADDNR